MGPRLTTAVGVEATIDRVIVLVGMFELALLVIVRVLETEAVELLGTGKRPVPDGVGFWYTSM